jgi:hypothetical protein
MRIVPLPFVQTTMVIVSFPPIPLGKPFVLLLDFDTFDSMTPCDDAGALDDHCPIVA